jgi:hypothetical protein
MGESLLQTLHFVGQNDLRYLKFLHDNTKPLSDFYTPQAQNIGQSVYNSRNNQSASRAV